MNEIFALIVGLVIGAVVATKMVKSVLMERFAAALHKLGISAEDVKRAYGLVNTSQKEEPAAAADTAPTLKEIPIKVEQHHGQLYAFQLEDDKFLGQGADREALLKRLGERLNNVKLTVTEENGAKYLQENTNGH